MEKSNFITVLEYLYEGGVNQKRDLLALFKDYFTEPNINDPLLTSRADKFYPLLDEMEKNSLIKYDKVEIDIGWMEDGNDSRDNHPLWASITITGIEYLRIFLLNDSVIKVNQSTIENNHKMAENAVSQTTILNKQTRLFYATAAFTFGSLAVSIYSVCSNNSKSLLQNSLNEQSKQIHSLQIQLSQAMTGSISNLREKKTNTTKKR